MVEARLAAGPGPEPAPGSQPSSRVTAVEPDPSRPGAVRVMVDGRLFCTVHEAAAAEGRFFPGAPWTEACRAAAGRAADEEAAWRALLRLLGRRSYAVREIRRRLSQKGHPPGAVEYAVLRAQGTRLLDDAEFARGYVESRASRGRGPARIRRDLMALGLERGHIEAALDQAWPVELEPAELARRLARRRLSQLAGLPRPARIRRVVAYLSRRGFSGPETIAMVRHESASP